MTNSNYVLPLVVVKMDNDSYSVMDSNPDENERFCLAITGEHSRSYEHALLIASSINAIHFIAADAALTASDAKEVARDALDVFKAA